MLQIDDNYAVKCDDGVNVELVKKRVIEKGQNAGSFVWDVVAYCPSLESAIAKYQRLEINAIVNLGLEQILKRIQELKEITMKLKEEDKR